MRTERLTVLFVLLVLLVTPAGAFAEEEATAAPLFGLFERAKAAVVTVRAMDIEAMGVAVADGTLVITAEHAVTNTAWVEVQSGKQVRQARVLYWDDSLAVLGLEAPLDYVAPLDISTLETRVGQQVWTLTRAAEHGLGRWALHESRVAAVGERKFEVDIQCSAGSLGAPVLDRQGRLAGLITEPERGEVVARRPEVLAEVLQESAGEETGPPEGVGLAFDVAMQWHLPLPQSSDNERELGIGFEGAILGGRHLMVPWSFRLAGTSGFWRPGSGEVNRSRFEFMVGLGGDFEVTLSRKPYVPLVFQVYGLAGLGMFFERDHAHTVQLVDPECDPAVEACSALVTREELLQRELPFVFGGGVRVHIPGMVFGFEVNTTASSPRDDLRLMFTMGFGGRKLRLKD